MLFLPRDCVGVHQSGGMCDSEASARVMREVFDTRRTRDRNEVDVDHDFVETICNMHLDLWSSDEDFGRYHMRYRNLHPWGDGASPRQRGLRQMGRIQRQR